MLDIIIPVLNEEKILSQRKEYFQGLKSKARLIFVDGGSKDQTALIAAQYGRVVVSPPGRGVQKNEGAAAAESENILFLHVDTLLAKENVDYIENLLNNGIIAGTFKLKIDDPSPVFRIFENLVNFQATCFRIFDGDQGLFIKRRVFYAAGQFDAVPHMEDILFSRKLKRAWETSLLPRYITASSREWRTRGFVRTFFKYFFFYSEFWAKSLLIRF
jgi:rSAM/selenodomain-associated transferase 2